jgi:RNA-binding protein
MTLSSKQRATLRAEAHHLTPSVHIGHHGVSDALVQALDDALRARELVKVHLLRAADTSARDVAADLARATHADVVQVIGRTATLYRENPELAGTHGDVPLWRRHG